MIMWHDMFTGNSAAKKALKEQINGMNSNLKQFLKMRMSSSCGILPFSVIELLRQGDQILCWWTRRTKK